MRSPGGQETIARAGYGCVQMMVFESSEEVLDDVGTLGQVFVTSDRVGHLWRHLGIIWDLCRAWDIWTGLGKVSRGCETGLGIWVFGSRVGVFCVSCEGFGSV